MIFVTVGSHYQGFDRLIKKMDEIAGNIDEQVVMQIGHTTYKPTNSQYFDFTEYSKMKQLNRNARVVVSHAGVGSILTALEQKTRLIIVPRLKKYGEVVDDHQLEIARELSENPNVAVAYDVDKFDEYLMVNFSFVEECNENRLVHSLKKYIHSI